MKLSVKLPEHEKNHQQPPLLLRAKIPITIFNLPFLSHFSTTPTHPSQISLALSSNFSSGPSLKFSYATTTTAPQPFTLTLKSGTGLFGSPKESPLIFSANFSFNPSNPNNPNPTFSIHFKPQLGSFSLKKSTFSHSKSDCTTDSANGGNGDSRFDSDSNSFAFVPLETMSSGDKVIPIGKVDKSSIFKGIQMAANTHMPVTKIAVLNLRWLMDFPVDKMPVLRVNKIGIESVEEKVRGVDEEKKRLGGASEVEMLKGMCFWMKRELDDLSRVNREMKCELAEMRDVRVVRDGGARKKSVESSSGGFEQWRNKKNGGSDNSNVNKKKEEGKNGSVAIDVESELQRAIAAAASS